MRRAISWGLMCAAFMLLSACATSSPDKGFEVVEQATLTQTGLKAQWQTTPQAQSLAQAEVGKLLAKPLAVNDAVQVALLNNRGLQAAYSELGIAQADWVQASRMPNPGFTFGRLVQGSTIEFDRSIHLDVLKLLTAPIASGIESRRFEQTQRMATLTTLSLVADVRKAWYNAVAAGETVRYRHQVLEAAQAGETLASRMLKAGNWNRLDHAREEGFLTDATLNLAKAQQLQTATREALIRLMGLSGEQTQFTLLERLPDLPPTPAAQPDVEQVALTQRLDVQAMKAQSEGLANSLGLNKTTRFINVLDLEGVRNTSNSDATQHGYSISLEIPLFDWGQARVAKAEALYMQSAHRLAQTAVNARSEIRQSYQAYRSSFDVARIYRDEVVPNRKRISEENLLRYNGMFISVFDLLADARSQVMAVNGYIDALRDFWLAQTDLDMAMVGKPSLGNATANVAPFDSVDPVAH